jgi:hypothetical protein
MSGLAEEINDELIARFYDREPPPGPTLDW